MEISNYTIEVLKNYADIQKNMWFKKGNQQASVSSGEDLFSQISFEETFPQDFGIYDLPQFLACLSFIDSPRLHFSDSYVTITDSAGLEKIDFLTCLKTKTSSSCLWFRPFSISYANSSGFLSRKM